jgi:hypothetical protein
MASVHYTTAHDPGDENDQSDFAYVYEHGEKCPFCDDHYEMHDSWVTPVCKYERRRQWDAPSYMHKTIVDVITSCGAPSCLKIAQALAAKWEACLSGCHPTLPSVVPG